jgi:cbb3-type cytochrome c oxidase subunit I
VAIWFYIATIITVAILHIFNNLVIPAGPTKSYSVYAGVQDAFMQWWYGHNAVAFFLTTPFLGLMYYFLPKAANRPVFSYKLSILHFWSIVFIYIWAGPHHLHYTALPEWASTLGMLFSVMLWMPSWGGMINGLLTLRGAWNRVAEDPVLKFFVVGITFYGMATFEGPLLSVKSVNALTPLASRKLTISSTASPLNSTRSLPSQGKPPGASSPSRSSKPNIKLRFWIACPAPPFIKLSRVLKQVTRRCPPSRGPVTTPTSA